MPNAKSLRNATIALTLLFLALAAQAKEPLTIFLVRHAEKQLTGSDPDLSEAGQKRAELLVGMLGDAAITTIFSSEYKRAQETAAPIAKKLGLTVTTVPAKEMDTLIAKIRALKPGSRALVVGHSNTVPAIATKLTGKKLDDFPESEFDRLLVATVWGDGEGDVALIRYGAKP